MLKTSLKANGGIILPLNHYAMGNSGGKGIFYAENGIYINRHAPHFKMPYKFL